MKIFKLQINNNQFIDLFITCCIKCQHDSVENWRIYLKSQFLIHRYAIIQTFEKYRYEITDRMRKFNSPSICITEEYREVSHLQVKFFMLLKKKVKQLVLLI